MPNRIATTDEVLKIAKGEIKNAVIVDSRTRWIRRHRCQGKKGRTYPEVAEIKCFPT